MEPLLVSVRDSATLLGVSLRTVQRLIEQGVLESVKIRKRRMVKMTTLIEIAERGVGHDQVQAALTEATLG